MDGHRHSSQSVVPMPDSIFIVHTYVYAAAEGGTAAVHDKQANVVRNINRAIWTYVA